MKLWGDTALKERTVKGFGKRLRTIRLAQGLTQEGLGNVPLQEVLDFLAY